MVAHIGGDMPRCGAPLRSLSHRSADQSALCPSTGFLPRLPSRLGACRASQALREDAPCGAKHGHAADGRDVASRHHRRAHQQERGARAVLWLCASPVSRSDTRRRAEARVFRWCDAPSLERSRDATRRGSSVPVVWNAVHARQRVVASSPAGCQSGESGPRSDGISASPGAHTWAATAGSNQCICSLMVCVQQRGARLDAP